MTAQCCWVVVAAGMACSSILLLRKSGRDRDADSGPWLAVVLPLLCGWAGVTGWPPALLLVVLLLAAHVFLERAVRQHRSGERVLRTSSSTEVLYVLAQIAASLLLAPLVLVSLSGWEQPVVAAQQG